MLVRSTVAACETTQQESAKIGREGSRSTSAPGTLKLGAVNRAVRVSDVTVVTGGGRTAVAAKLELKADPTTG